MKANGLRVWFVGVLLVGSSILTADTAEAALTTNSWNDGSSKWELGANWSAGVPSLANAIDFVSGGFPVGARTITIDPDTVFSNVINGCMTISNLTVSGTALAPNSVFINNVNVPAGNTTMTILNSLTISSHGAVSITNSVLKVAFLGGSLSDDGFMQLNTGTIIVTNGLLSIGRNGSGTFIMSDGTVLASDVAVADQASSQGSFTIAGGTNKFQFFSMGGLANAVGTVWMTGGQLTVSNEATVVGIFGSGQMTVSNGTWAASSVLVSSEAGSAGTLTIAGGTHKFSSLSLAEGSGATTATVWLVGGGLSITNNTNIPGVTNNTTVVGVNGIGQMTVSNSIFLARDMYVGTNTGSQGTFTVAGGTNTLTSFLHVGERAGATGAVWMVGGQLTVTNDVIILGLNGVGQMTVSNGTCLARNLDVGFGAGSQGTVTAAGGVTALTGPMLVGNGGGTGNVLVTGGQLVVTNNPALVGAGNGFVVDGSVAVSNGSSIVVSNVDAIVGNRGSGTLTNAGGLVSLANNLTVGNFSGSQGTITVLGGGVVENGSLTLGKSAVAAGTLWMMGGTLFATNNSGTGQIIIGSAGRGAMIVSNGTVQVDQTVAGNAVNGSGVLTIAGGSYQSPSTLTLGEFPPSTGTVWVTSGVLALTNNITTATIFTHDGIAQLTVSNGQVIADNVLIASLSFVGRGTFTFVGGTCTINTNLVLGNWGCSGQGHVVVAGGGLFVTNASHTAVLDVHNGTLELDSGTLVIDKLVMTNACGLFVRTGGTLVCSNVVLDPNLDADGDGIPNGYEQAHGLDPLNAADANLDNDGDGFSNLVEYQGGSDPNNSNSIPFRITSISRTGTNIVLVWNTVGGKTNVVQATGGATGGSYSNNFTDISPLIVPVGTGLTSEFYTDPGGATNIPARYYRVRLVP